MPLSLALKAAPKPVLVAGSAKVGIDLFYLCDISPALDQRHYLKLMNQPTMLSATGMPTHMAIGK
jgi:hypothetical protein